MASGPKAVNPPSSTVSTASRRPTGGAETVTESSVGRYRPSVQDSIQHGSIEETDGSASARVLRGRRRGAELHPGRRALPGGAVGAEPTGRAARADARGGPVRTHEPRRPAPPRRGGA